MRFPSNDITRIYLNWPFLSSRFFLFNYAWLRIYNYSRMRNPCETRIRSVRKCFDVSGIEAIHAIGSIISCQASGYFFERHNLLQQPGGSSRGNNDAITCPFFTDPRQIYNTIVWPCTKRWRTESSVLLHELMRYISWPSYLFQAVVRRTHVRCDLSGHWSAEEPINYLWWGFG